MELMRVETFQAESMDTFLWCLRYGSCGKMATDLKALREAPLAEPFDGPRCFRGAPRESFFTKCWAIGSKAIASAESRRGRLSLRRWTSLCFQIF